MGKGGRQYGVTALHLQPPLPPSSSSSSGTSSSASAAGSSLDKTKDDPTTIPTAGKFDQQWFPLDWTPVAFGMPPDGLPQQHEQHEKNNYDGSAADGFELVQQQPPPQLPLYQLALAGSLTTFGTDIIMHPMDSIKTLQQSNVELTLLAAATVLWETSALFHGFFTYAVSDAVSGAIKFTVWELWKDKTASGGGTQPLPPFSPATNNNELSSTPTPSLLTLLVGAALAFVASSFTQVPGELLKQQLQMSYYDSLPSAIAGIYQQQGMAGFYAGYEAVLYRDVPYTMLELGLYEVFKKLLLKQQQEPPQSLTPPHQQESPSCCRGTDEFSTARLVSDTDNESATTTSVSSLWWEEMGAAAVTGAFTAVLTTPVDSIKTLLMIDPHFADATFVECLITTVHQHGPWAVFAGVVPRVAWIVPFTAIYLPTYDAIKRFLLQRQIAAMTQPPKETKVPL